jgi:uncharacterized membrane protein YgdD (TMEM256/DUF423 family)
MGRGWLLLGAIHGGIAVAAGAFGAHGLRGHLDAQALAVFHTAVEYQGNHALALLAVALLALAHPANRWLRAAGGCFAVGILVFSGSLYGLSLLGWRWLAWFTPGGGLLLLGGWLLLGLAALRWPNPGPGHP